MINCSRISPTTEETRSWQPNIKSTRGLVFNARTALGRSLQSTNFVLATCPSSAIAQLVPSKGTSLAQVPLPLGLDNRSSASPTGTRQSLNLFHPKEQASLKCPSHWASAIAQVPLSLGLGNRSTCSIQKNELRSSAPPTGTRLSLNLFHPKERASLKCLSHWDSAIAQLVPSKGTSLAQLFPPPTKHKSRLVAHINVRPEPCGTYFIL
ncbi:hypothetical protein Adt_04296 [Abeliophyllum distichum]|uniref:Uncharacterized protein n=1 Tax=Abeliophyllum distichum TaxID=126358 RepID=A0ABD1W3D8_9LAMI